MATQWLISITDKYWNVKYKIICWQDWYNIPKIANKIKKLSLDVLSIKKIEKYCNILWWVAIINDKLDVWWDRDNIEELTPLYESTFNNPFFNPRWERGYSSYTEIVIL